MHRLFEQFISTDATSVCLEGGANIGSHSVKLAMLCGFLHAFEPFPPSYRLVQQNLVLNGLSNCNVQKVGISDHTSATHFQWTAAGNNAMVGLAGSSTPAPRGMSVEDRYRNVQVPLTTIDALQLTSLDFIKMDVEGFEDKALMGGIDTIRRFRPTIAVESWSGFGTVSYQHTRKRFGFILDLNYTLHRVRGPDYLLVPVGKTTRLLRPHNKD